MKNKGVVLFRPKKVQEWRRYEKGSLLENGLALNGMATFVWSLCDGKKDVEEIINEVEKDYEVDRKKAETDVMECIKTLVDEGGLE